MAGLEPLLSLLRAFEANPRQQLTCFALLSNLESECIPHCEVPIFCRAILWGLAMVLHSVIYRIILQLVVSTFVEQCNAKSGQLAKSY